MGWGADWAVRAALKTSAVLLKYSIYFFFIFSLAKNQQNCSIRTKKVN